MCTCKIYHDYTPDCEVSLLEASEPLWTIVNVALGLLMVLQGFFGSLVGRAKGGRLPMAMVASAYLLRLIDLSYDPFGTKVILKEVSMRRAAIALPPLPY
jgi:hypothetical protein